MTHKHHSIIALWATPRSTSTAFEWMMRQRGDLNCLHEPFGEAWYQGEEPLWHRFQTGDKTTKGLTLESVWESILKMAESGPVLMKDFPHYINHLWDKEFLSHFTHAFLIRDPALSVTSMYDKWPDFHDSEVGYPEQRALFDLLHALNGKPPPVIDSSDVLEQPQEMVRAFCDSVSIPYMPEALTWEAGADTSAYSWWDGGSFHQNLKTSTGLVRQERKYVEIDKTPERVRQVYRRQLPHYQHLYKYRIGVG